MRLMSYREKDFQREFNRWAMANYDGSAAFELKITKGKSLPYSMLAEHQRHALLGVKGSNNEEGRGVIYKIPDLGYQNPFDCFKLQKLPAFVVVLFYVPYKKKTFYMIDIDRWVESEAGASRKSLTEEEARKIGERVSL